jgi:hypothetical protein
MRWSEVTAPPTDRKLREFAAAAAIVCAGLAAVSVYRGSIALATACAAISLAAILIGLGRPRWLAPLFTATLVLTFPIAWTVSLLLLAILFYGLVTPLALAFRILGRDPLSRKLPRDQASYWQSKPQAANSRRYFRQY